MELLRKLHRERAAEQLDQFLLSHVRVLHDSDAP